uniref:m7GpppX diphosphatase n=1 Tax=Cupiennius salei TaxID=6928 RepID=T1DFV7_CUPSA
MASEVSSTESENCKRIKLSSESDDVRTPTAEDLSAHARLNSFEGFKLNQILSDNIQSKSVFFEGSFEATDDCAVVLLEKLPVIKESVDKLLNNADLALNLKSKSQPIPNVANYACYPKVDRGDVKATIICPATPKHVEKYLFQPLYVFEETPEIYEKIVLPHLSSQKFSMQWVYNILEHKSETERIVFEDPDPDIGFVLLPDLKWDEAEKGSIYLIAICHTRSVKSLRDLNDSHLPLLRNIKLKSLDAISEKYNISAENLRIYVHYQPSYYHLHVHFSSVQKVMPGTQFEKARLLDTIMNNIEMCSSYYRQATLTYTLKQNDPLFVKLKEASLIKI